MKEITPLTLMLFGQFGMIALHWILPLGSISSWVLFILGIGFIAFGVLIAVVAEGQFRRSGTTVDHLGRSTNLIDFAHGVGCENDSV